MDSCHEELQRVRGENDQLKLRLQGHERELVQLKATVSSIGGGQPSTISTVSCPTQTCSLPSDSLGDIWRIEVNGPAPQNLFQMYELQSQFFFLVTGSKKFAWIDHTLFQQIWEQNIKWGVENLLA